MTTPNATPETCGREGCGRPESEHCVGDCQRTDCITHAYIAPRSTDEPTCDECGMTYRHFELCSRRGLVNPPPCGHPNCVGAANCLSDPHVPPTDEQDGTREGERIAWDLRHITDEIPPGILVEAANVIDSLRATISELTVQLAAAEKQNATRWRNVGEYLEALGLVADASGFPRNGTFAHKDGRLADHVTARISDLTAQVDRLTRELQKG